MSDQTIDPFAWVAATDPAIAAYKAAAMRREYNHAVAVACALEEELEHTRAVLEQCVWHLTIMCAMGIEGIDETLDAADDLLWPEEKHGRPRRPKLKPGDFT